LKRSAAFAADDETLERSRGRCNAIGIAAHAQLAFPHGSTFRWGLFILCSVESASRRFLSSESHEMRCGRVNRSHDALLT
jgi:hypothetical protein